MRRVLLIGSGSFAVRPDAPSGPNYQRPTVPTPETFRAPEPLPPAQAASFADLKWFEVFKDEKLQDLVRTGLAAKLRPARRRRARGAARASLGITRSDQFPNFGAGGAVDINRLSREGATPLPAAAPAHPESQFRNRRASTCCRSKSTSGGRLRRATEAARANLLSADENRKAVVTTLVSDVATAYLTLRELDYELEISTRTLQTRQESLELTQIAAERAASPRCSTCARRNNSSTPRRKPSRTPAADRADGESDQAPARRKPRQRDSRKQSHRAELPPEVPAGLPSALAGTASRYSRRGAGSDRRQRADRRGEGGLFPDVESQRGPGRSRAHNCPACSADRPAPGTWRRRSPSRFSPRAASNPTSSWPRPSGSSALIQYEKTDSNRVHRSLQRLIAHQRFRESRDKQEALETVLEDRVRLAYMRYRGGVDTQLNALDADRDLFQAQLDLSRLRLEEILSVVQLYKALGGGWQS